MIAPGYLRLTHDVDIVVRFASMPSLIAALWIVKICKKLRNRDGNETCDPAGMGWDQCTAEGSEIARHRVWMELTWREKLEATERLSELALKLLARRKKPASPISILTRAKSSPVPAIDF